MRCQLYELAYELAWLQRRTNLEKQNNPPHFSQPKPNKTKQNNASERRRLRRKRPVEHDGLLKSTAMPQTRVIFGQADPSRCLQGKDARRQRL